jgi:hypothetical protein
MMLSSRKRPLLVVVVAALVGVLIWEFALSEPTIRIDSIADWRIEFGRGSGMDGLDTVKIASDGSVILHRFKRKGQPEWETTSLSLPPDALAKVLESVAENRLLGMSREYRADVYDGTQWVFWFRQKEAEKSVYFDNKFPRAIKRFAADLDRILQENGLDAAVWQPVQGPAGQHDRELWKSIRRE